MEEDVEVWDRSSVLRVRLRNLRLKNFSKTRNLKMSPPVGTRRRTSGRDRPETPATSEDGTVQVPTLYTSPS